MINIYKKFNKTTARLIVQIDYVMDRIERFNDAGTTIRRVHGNKACYDPHKNRVILGRRCSAKFILQTLPHEDYHRMHPTRPPNFGKTRRCDWVKRQLEIEVAATIAEFPVIEALLARGVKLNRYDLQWYRLYKTGGRKALLAKMRKTLTSTTHTYYPDYYRDLYDDYIKDHKRRCGGGANTCKPGVDHELNVERMAAYQRRRDRELFLSS